jgi:hypothetical protein
LVWCDLEADDLAAVEAITVAGIRSSREEVIAWLVREGLQAQQALLARLAKPAGEPPEPPAAEPSGAGRQ